SASVAPTRSSGRSTEIASRDELVTGPPSSDVICQENSRCPERSRAARRGSMALASTMFENPSNSRKVRCSGDFDGIGKDYGEISQSCQQICCHVDFQAINCRSY